MGMVFIGVAVVESREGSSFVCLSLMFLDLFNNDGWFQLPILSSNNLVKKSFEKEEHVGGFSDLILLYMNSINNL